MKLVQVRRQRAGDHLRIIGLLDSSDAHPYFAFPQGLEAAVSESAAPVRGAPGTVNGRARTPDRAKRARPTRR